MKTVFAFGILFFSVMASAQQFKSVTIDDSSKNYDAVLTYHKLTESASAIAFQSINDSVLATLRDNGCGADDAAASENGMDYTVNARLIALNKSYVAYEITEDSYCGGAHPNYSSYYVTYNAKTGEEINMDEQLKLQLDDVDYDVIEDYQAELAEIIYESSDFTKVSNVCFEGLSKDEALDQINQFYPYVAGLAKGKKVVLALSVPHVAAPCAFSVRVSLAAVAHLFKNDSVLFSLTNY